MHRRVGSGLDLAAKPTDVDIYRSRIPLVCRAPHTVEQLTAGIGTPRTGGQHGQELEFLRPEMDQ
jgi:hypothetical protein